MVERLTTPLTSAWRPVTRRASPLQANHLSGDEGGPPGFPPFGGVVGPRWVV